MEETDIQKLAHRLEMYQDWVKDLRSNRKYLITGGFLLGLGTGLIIASYLL